MGSIEEPPETLDIDDNILSVSFHNRQKVTEMAWMTTVKKFINQSGSFENTAKFKWQAIISIYCSL